MSETSSKARALHTGGCRCGAVRFSSAGAPDHVSYCHCNDCRRATGSPLAAFVGFLVDDVTLDGDALGRYGTHPVSRSFCGICGAPIAYQDARIGDHIYFYLGAMHTPETYRPTVHAHVQSQLPYLHMPDGLPRTTGTSVPRPDGTTE